MTRTVVIENVTTIASPTPPPGVPAAEGVNIAALTAGDTAPLFVTLPIGKAETRSRNGVYYNREAAEAIRDAINTRRVGGILGHITDEQRASRFDVPTHIWVGAMIDESGTVWGKTYVLNHATALRSYLRAAEAAGSAVGTSIYGTGEMDASDNVRNLYIEGIDFAHPDRVGVPTAAALPVITSETQHGESGISRYVDIPGWDARRAALSETRQTDDGISRYVHIPHRRARAAEPTTEFMIIPREERRNA